ncbi:MAG TPA: type II secretion system F family protein [Sumerlaeia bacterium]|nr:type II secretion system F family protein [Sumerlaeia bacterium]
MTPSDKKRETKDALRDSLRSKLRGDSPNPEDAASGPRKTLPPADAPAGGAAKGGGGGGGGGGSLLRTQIAFGAPGLAQMTAFCRQLATLVDVGIPLVQSLSTLSRRIEHPKLKRVVGDVARRVEEGESFSQSLAAHPKVFSSLVVNVVRIGEQGGILEESLKYLAEIMERRYDLRRRVTAALAYPTAALIVCGVVVLIILGFAIPVFEEVYKEVELPGITRVVLALSNFVQAAWWLIVAVVVALVFGLRRLVKSSSDARRMWDELILKMPIVSGLAVKINVTRTCRTLYNLLRAGIPLLEGLTITAETAENLVVAGMIRDTHDNLEKGGQIVDPLREAGIFPDLVIDMIAIGEETGRLDVMFEKIAETYDSDVNNSIRTLNAILEPALIIIMGTIILVLALAVLLPYWRLGKTFET